VQLTCRLLLIVVLSLVIFGCSKDPPVTSTFPVHEWTSISFGVELSEIVDMDLNNNILHIASRDAVHLQNPAFYGKWKSLTPQLDSLDLTQGRYGIGSVSRSCNGIVIGLIQSPHIYPGILEWTEGSGPSEWTSRSNGIGSTNILDTVATLSGSLFAGTNTSGIHVSSDCGELWSPRTSDIIANDLEFFDEPGGLFAAGRGAFLNPLLFASSDSGSTWDVINIESAMPIRGDGMITSVSSPSHNDTLLTVTTDYGSFLLHSNTLTGRLELVKWFEGEGYVSADPAHPGDILLAADSLYHSSDLGATWIAYPSPEVKGWIRQMIVDWDHRYTIVVSQRDQGATVFLMNLGSREEE
jgi:hypothetical protein